MRLLPSLDVGSVPAGQPTHGDRRAATRAASPLSDLNDSAVHAPCLDLRTDADAARSALNEYVERHR